MNDTNLKGNIATSKVCVDLISKGYEVFVPFTEHSKTDLVALKDSCIRLQVKYTSCECIRNTSTTNSGIHKYTEKDVDFIAAYLSEIDKVIYIPIELVSGKNSISIKYLGLVNSRDVWWYEDFLLIETVPQKRFIHGKYQPKPNLRKVDRPSFEELKNLIDLLPITKIAKSFNVTDSCIIKWCKELNIETKGRGYWTKRKY